MKYLLIIFIIFLVAAMPIASLMGLEWLILTNLIILAAIVVWALIYTATYCYKTKGA